MSNKIFQSILDEKISFFRYTFEQTSKSVFIGEDGKLIHPGEYGTYRENACKDFLKMIIPNNLEIGSGFVLTDKGSYSTQCDIVIFDKNSTPLIENSERQRFFPVETLVAIGEIKSDLSKSDFINAINKLARSKKLREEVSHPSILKRTHDGNFDPKTYPYDNIFSFLICNKFTFDFKNIVNEIDSFYEADIEPRHKHNLILSVNDGLLSYYDDNDKTMMYPFVKKILKNRLTIPGENINCHFYFASSYIFMGTTSATILYPEISDYLSGKGGFNMNQN